MICRVLFALFALFALTTAADAGAFCRSTTCRSTASQPCETDDDGCSVTGAKLFWPTRCLSYATNALGTQSLDPADTRDVIRKTFQAWSDVPCAPRDDRDGDVRGNAQNAQDAQNARNAEAGPLAENIASMTFQERDPVSCKKSEYNKTGPNVNVVLFQDDDWKYRGTDATLAKTSVTYNDDTGEIYDADIEINAAFNALTISDDPKNIEYDLQAILTHEVGHFIGIAHSPDPDAVMFASYVPGSTAQRALTADDVAAVCAIYPPGASTACNVEPRGGFRGSCGESVVESGCSISTMAGKSRTAPPYAALLAGAIVAAIVARRTSLVGRKS